MTTTTKKLTPKQLGNKAQSLLRGIDNSTTSIAAHQKKINAAMPELKKTLTALSNTDVKTAVAKTKPAAKVVVAKPAKVKPTAKVKLAVKSVKLAVKSAKVKPAAKVKPTKAEASERKDAEKDRPTLRDATKEFLKGNKKMPKSNLYKAVTDKYGYWSRQSFYSILKDEATFNVDELNNVSLKTGRTSDKDAESFIKNVEKDQSVSQAV